MTDSRLQALADRLRPFVLPTMFVIAAIPAAAFSNQMLSAARSASIQSVESRLDGLVAVLRYGDLPFLRLEIDRLATNLPARGRVGAVSDRGVTLGIFGSAEDRQRLVAMSGDGPSIVQLSTGPVLARKLDLAQTPPPGMEDFQDLTLYVADPWPGPAERATRQAVLTGWLAFILALTIGLGFQLWYAREYRRRLDRLNRRLATIGQGDLKDLEPDPAAPRELAQLRRNINLMLDDLRELVFGLNAFVETVAHELRTPLTRMRLSAERVLREGVADNPAEVAGLKGDVLDLSRLFESLVDLAKARAGRFDRSAFAPMDVSRLLNEIHEDFEEDMAAAGHPLVLDATGACRVLGDSGLVRRLIENLLDNARKFSTPGRPVRIDLRSDQGRFHLAVENMGSAFPAEFDGMASTRSIGPSAGWPGRGLGLGLGVVRAIALKHGWSIRFSHVDGTTRVELDGDTISNRPQSDGGGSTWTGFPGD